MHQIVASPVHSRKRIRKCVFAWMLALAVLSIAIASMVRYERVLANGFDWPILLTLNHHAFPVEFVNRSISGLSEMRILTGILLASLFWYLWFECQSDSARTGLLLGFGAAIAAVILSRGLQLALPTHLRPLDTPLLRFKPPPGSEITKLNGWDSFPSDHACLYFALAAVIWRQSRALGLFALMPALLGTLPRIYLGYHYPSDIVAGAVLGILIVILVENYGPEAFAHRVLLFERQSSGMFYFLGFLLTYSVGTLFDDVRSFGLGLAHAVHAYQISGL